MLRIRTLAAAAVALCCLSGVANAAPVTVRDNPNINGSSNFADGLSNNVTIRYRGGRFNLSAGLFALQWGSEQDGWNDFLTFCMQISEPLAIPNDYERITGADYFTNDANRIALSTLYHKLSNGTLGVVDGASAAAAQVIVWEIMEDGAENYDLRRGRFGVLRPAIRDLSDAMWAMISTSEETVLDIDIFSARGTQDLLVTPIPIPGSAILLLSGIFGLGFAARQQKRSRSV